jgi:NADPH:quinone reductase-like Zn-dependent oxidoreductase
MKAVMLDGPGSQPALRDDVPTPVPGPGEVLVRVQASSANPVDNAIAAGMLRDMVPHEFPVMLGRDFAGVVEDVGSGVDAVSAGDPVFGMVPAMGPGVHDGAWAERIVVPASSLGRLPGGVDIATAGAAPLAAITALLAVDALDLSPGDTVLIAGATGGVGSIACQLAVAAGATVLAPARPDDEDYLRGLGVSEILPRDGDVVAAVRAGHPDGVDAVVDLVNYAPGTYDAVLKDRGRVASPTNAAGDGPGRTNVMAAPSPELLDRIARHLADRTITVPIRAQYPLAQAPEALRALASGRTRGKIAIEVGAD